MAKNCEIQLQGQLICDGDSACCCYKTECVELPCNTRLDAIKDIIDDWPEGYRYKELIDFNADGFLLIYERPCDPATTPGG